MAEYARVGDPKYLGAYIKPEELIIIGDVALVGGPTKVEVADIMSGQVVPFYRINDNVISPTKYNTSVTIDVIFSAPLIEEPNQTLDRMLDSETLANFPHQKHLYVDFHHFYSLLKLFPIVPVYGERLNQLVSGSWVDDSVRMYQIDMVQVNTLPNTSGQLQVKLIMSPVQQSYDQRDQLSIMYRDGFTSDQMTQKSYFFDSKDIRTQIENDVNERINTTKQIVDNGVKSQEQTTIQNLAKSMKLVFDINYIIATLYMQAKWQLGLEFNGDQLTKEQQLHYSKVNIEAFNGSQNASNNFNLLKNAFDGISNQINSYVKNNLVNTTDGPEINNTKDISNLFSIDITNNRSVHITSVQVQYDNQVVGYNTHQDRTIRQYMGSNRERGTMHLIVQNDEDGREFIDSIQSLRNLSQSIVSQQQGMVNQQPLLVRGILNIFGITNIYITNFQVSTLDDMPNQFSCMLQFVSTSGNVLHSEQREVNHQFAAFKKQQMNQQLDQIRNNNKVAYYTFNSSGWICRTTKPLFDANGRIDWSVVQLINNNTFGGKNIYSSKTQPGQLTPYQEFIHAREIINQSIKEQILKPIEVEAKSIGDEKKKQQLNSVASNLVDLYKNYVQEHYTLTAIYFDYMIHYKQFTGQLMTSLLQLYLHQNLLAQQNHSELIQNDPGKVINKIISWSKDVGDKKTSGTSDKELENQITFLNDIISVIQEKYTIRNLRHFHASIISGIRMLFYKQSVNKSINKNGNTSSIDYTLDYGPLRVIADQYYVTNGLYNVFDGKSTWKKLGDAWDQMLKALPALMMQPTIGMDYIPPYPAGYNWFDSIADDTKNSSQYNLSLQYIVALFYINGGQFASNIDQQLVTENQFSQSLISNYGDILFSDYAKKLWLMQPAQGSRNVRVKDLLYSKSELKPRDYSQAAKNLRDKYGIKLDQLNADQYTGVQLDIVKEAPKNSSDISTPTFNRIVMANQVTEMYKMMHSFGMDIQNISNKLNEFVINYMNLGDWLDTYSPAYYIYNFVYGQKSLINKQGNVLTKLMFNVGGGSDWTSDFHTLVTEAVRVQFYNQETDSIVDLAKDQKANVNRMVLQDADLLYGDIQKQFELYMSTTSDSDFLAKIGTKVTSGKSVVYDYTFVSDLFNWLIKQGRDGKYLILQFCTNFSSFYYDITDVQYNDNSQRIDLLRHYSQLDDMFNYMHDMLQFVDLQESNFLSALNLQLVQSGFLSPWDLNYRLPTEPRDLFISGKNAGKFDDFYLQNEDQTQNLQVMQFVSNYISTLSTNMQGFTSKTSSDQQQLSDLFTVKSTQQSLLDRGGQYQKDADKNSNKSIYDKIQSVENTYNSMVQNQGTENQYVNLGFNSQATNTPYIPSDTLIKQLLQDPMYRQEIMQSQNQHDPTVDDSLTKFEFTKLMENYMKLNNSSNYITRQNDLFLTSLKSQSTVEILGNKNTRNNIQLNEYNQQTYMQTYILKRLIEDTTRRLSMSPQQCIIFNLKRGSSTNYEFRQYVYYQVEDVAVMREQDNPIDSQVVKLYSMLDYSGERFVDNNYVAVGQDTKEMPVGQLLKPGVDIEIRMGYSKNVAELTKVFVGYIRDVQYQNGEQEFIAEGYGQQLAKPIYKKPELYTGFFNTPKDRVVDQIKRVGQPELGLSRAQDVSEKLFQYIMPHIDDAQTIRSQFSWLQHRQYLPAYDNVYNPSDYYTTLQTGSSSVWSVPKDYFQNFEHHFEHYTAQQGYSAWDVIEDQQLASPDYICQVEPLEDVAGAQRVFFGKAHYPFKYYYYNAPARAAGKIQSTWANMQVNNTASNKTGDNAVDPAVRSNYRTVYMSSTPNDLLGKVMSKDGKATSSTKLIDVDQKEQFSFDQPFKDDYFTELQGFRAYIDDPKKVKINRGTDFQEPSYLYTQYLLNNWQSILGIGKQGIVTKSPDMPYEANYLNSYIPGLSLDDLQEYKLQQLPDYDKNDKLFSFVFMPSNQDSSEWKAKVSQSNIDVLNTSLYGKYVDKSNYYYDISGIGFINQIKEIMFGSTLAYDSTINTLNLFEDVIQIDILDRKAGTPVYAEDANVMCNLQIGFAFIDKNIYSGQPIVVDLSAKYRKYLVILPRTISYQSKRDEKSGVGQDVGQVKLAHGIQLLQQFDSANKKVKFRIRHLWQETISNRLQLSGGKIVAYSQYNKKYNQTYPIDQTKDDKNAKQYTVGGKTYSYSKLNQANWYKLVCIKDTTNNNNVGLIVKQTDSQPIDLTVTGEKAIVHGYFTKDFQSLVDIIFNNNDPTLGENNDAFGYRYLFGPIDAIDVKFDRQKVLNRQYKSYSLSELQSIYNVIYNTTNPKQKPKLHIIGKGRLTFGYQLTDTGFNTNEFVVNQLTTTGGQLVIKQWPDLNADGTLGTDYKMRAYIRQHMLDVYVSRVAEYFDLVFNDLVAKNAMIVGAGKAPEQFLHMYGVLQLYQQSYSNRLQYKPGISQNTSMQQTSQLNPLQTKYQTIEQMYAVYLADVYAANYNQEMDQVVNYEVLQNDIQRYVLGKWKFADGENLNIISNTYNTGITSSKKITSDLVNQNLGIDQQSYSKFVKELQNYYNQVIQAINNRILGQPAQQTSTPGVNDMLERYLITKSLVDLNDAKLKKEIYRYIAVILSRFGLTQALFMPDNKKVSQANQSINVKKDDQLKTHIEQLLIKYYKQLYSLMLKNETDYIDKNQPTKSYLQLDKNLYEIQSFEHFAHNTELNNVSAFTYYYQLKSFIMPQLGNAAHIKYLMEKFFDQYGFDQASGSIKYGASNQYSVPIGDSKAMQANQSLWHTWITGDPNSTYPKITPMHLLRVSKRLYIGGIQNIDYFVKPTNINQLGLTEQLSYDDVINHIKANMLDNTLNNDQKANFIKVNSKSSFNTFVDKVKQTINSVSVYKEASKWINDFEQQYDVFKINQSLDGKYVQNKQSGQQNSLYNIFSRTFINNDEVMIQIIQQYLDSNILDNLQYIVNMTNYTVVDMFPQLYKPGFGFVQQRSFDLQQVSAQPFSKQYPVSKSPSVFQWLFSDQFNGHKFTNYLLQSNAKLNYPVHISNFVRRSFINPQLQMQPDVQTDLQFQLSGVLFFIPSQLIAYIATDTSLSTYNSVKLKSVVYEKQLNQYKLLNVFLSIQRMCIDYMEQLGEHTINVTNMTSYLKTRACFANQLINFQSYQMLAEVEISMSRAEMDQFIQNQDRKVKLNDGSWINIFNFVTISDNGYTKVKKQYDDNKLVSDNRGIWNLKKPGRPSEQNSYIKQLDALPKLNGTQVKFQSWYPYWDDQFGFTICLGGPLHNSGINYQFLATKYAEYMNIMLQNVNKAIQQNVEQNFFKTDQNYRFTTTKQLIDSVIRSFNPGV